MFKPVITSNVDAVARTSPLTRASRRCCAQVTQIIWASSTPSRPRPEAPRMAYSDRQVRALQGPRDVPPIARPPVGRSRDAVARWSRSPLLILDELRFRLYVEATRGWPQSGQRPTQ